MTVTLVLVAAVLVNHRARERRARDFVRRQLRLRDLAGFENDTLGLDVPSASAAPMAPPRTPRAGLAF